MADKLTVLELHLHAEDNEFDSNMELSSDVGGLLRRRLGLGGESDEEDESDLGEEIKSEVEERTPVETTTDGGDTVQVDEEDEERGAVVEIDADTDVDEESEEEEEGRSKTKGLFVLLVLVAITVIATRYLSGDDLEDEFEEL